MITYPTPTYYGAHLQQQKIPGNTMFNTADDLNSLTICNIKFYHSTKKHTYVLCALEKVTVHGLIFFSRELWYRTHCLWVHSPSKG